MLIPVLIDAFIFALAVHKLLEFSLIHRRLFARSHWRAQVFYMGRRNWAGGKPKSWPVLSPLFSTMMALDLCDTVFYAY